MNASLPITCIEPSSGALARRVRDLADDFERYHELLYFLVWRDLKLRYKQTVLGAGWVILQPLLTMAVFSLFFGRLAKIPSDAVPYPVFALAGLVPWMFFANGLGQASSSVIASGNVIKKIYFPRLMIPLSAILSGLIDLLLSVGVLIAAMACYGIAPSARAPWAAAFLLLPVVTSLGAGLWLAALNVKYRDVRYVVPFLIQFWMFATPVAYPSSLLSQPWRVLFGLNPMAGAIEGFRWSLLGSNTSPGPMLAVSSAVALVLLVSGLWYFNRAERSFADVL
jgi:lipopolysaccharide transport system permease protein